MAPVHAPQTASVTVAKNPRVAAICKARNRAASKSETCWKLFAWKAKGLDPAVETKIRQPDPRD